MTEYLIVMNEYCSRMQGTHFIIATLMSASLYKKHTHLNTSGRR